MKIMTSFTAVGLHAHQDLLPENSHFPQLHSRLDDGRLSPATVPLGGAPRLDFDDSFDEPSFIFDLDSLDSACHPHAHRAASAVVESLAFLSLYDALHTTPTGRARLLDGSNSRGPFSWLRRLPIPTLDACETPFFAFTNPEHFPIALALDLLLPPPAQGRGHFTACSACATIAHPGGKPLAGPGDRHFVACPHGLKLHSTAHDPTVQALVPFLDAILGSSRVTAERGGLGGQRAVDQWMQGAGADVDHAPDIILRDFDKAGSRGPICSSTSRRWTRLGRRTSLQTTPIERALQLTSPSPLTRVDTSMGFSLLTCALSSWRSARAGLSIPRATLSSRA